MTEEPINEKANANLDEASEILMIAENLRQVMKEMIRWQENPCYKADRSEGNPSILEELRAYQS